VVALQSRSDLCDHFADCVEDRLEPISIELNAVRRPWLIRRCVQRHLARLGKLVPPPSIHRHPNTGARYGRSLRGTFRGDHERSKLAADLARSSTVPVRLWIQPIDATVWWNRSAGVSKFNVFLGRSFSLLATALSFACE
jgi:hypothetical protein